MAKRGDKLCRLYGDAADVERLRAAPRAVGASWLLGVLLLFVLAVAPFFGAVSGETAAVAQAAKTKLHLLAAYWPGHHRVSR